MITLPSLVDVDKQFTYRFRDFVRITYSLVYERDQNREFILKTAQNTFLCIYSGLKIQCL